MESAGKGGWSSDQWQRLKQLFDAALELDDVERAAFVARSCEGNAELQRTLDSLLAHAAETGSTFDQAVNEALKVDSAPLDGPDLVGRTLGRYRVVERIGAGAMGEVFRAIDTELGRKVAIKILPEAFLSDPERLARFEREARALAALNHPNIATIHTVGESDGLRFLVLELVEGETLRSRLAAGPLAIREVVRLAAQIADGLATAHAAGITHRDLKPDNLMLADDGRVKILDFGLAKGGGIAIESASALATEAHLETEAGRVMGTTAYMSPEQARGEEVDHRSDQFSFGAIVCEMATGRRAFAGDTAADTMVAILTREPDLPADYEAAVPPDVRRIVERCLAKDPEDRYHSTHDLAKDLHGLGEPSQQVKAEDHQEPSRASSRLTRGQWLVVALAVAALIVAGILWNLPSETELPETWNLEMRSESRDRWRDSDTRAARRESASIAVLPLANLGPANEEYFADGMTDALITQLSKIEALRVISRTSVMRYKGSDRSLPEIARELGVDTVLTGSVLHGGDRVRVSAQLTEAGSDRNLWAESYEQDRSDILALQSQVAEAVVEAIRVEVDPDEQRRLAESREIDPTAHEAYLRGIDAYEQAAFGGLNFDVLIRASFEYFQRAIELEPEWADPWARLATAYHWLASSGGVDLQAEFYPKSKAAALRALELDDTVALAHAALGWVLLNHEWNWSAADAAYRRSLELDPNTALGHYGLYLRSAGYYDEAIEYLERDAARRPGTTRPFYWIAWTLLCAGRPDEAAAIAMEELEAAPDDADAHFLLGRAQILRTQYAEAVRSIETSIGLAGEPRRFVTRMHAYALAKAGRVDEARQTLLELEEEGVDWMPELYMALGEQDRAMAQIEAAFAVRRDVMLSIRCYPEYENLLTIPRFREIVVAIGFPS